MKGHRKTIINYVISMHTSVTFSILLSLFLTLSHCVVDLDLDVVLVNKAAKARKWIETH